MKTQQELLVALRGRFGDSQTAIAEALGMDLARLNNYVRGVRKMDEDAVIACCEALGWNTDRYVAKHKAETARTKREEAYWTKRAATAALLLMIALPWANPAAAYTQCNTTGTTLTSTSNRHYAKCEKGLLVAVGAAFVRSPQLIQLCGVPCPVHPAGVRASHRTPAPTNSSTSAPPTT